jgi:outer membrane protein assembly factor BamB
MEIRSRARAVFSAILFTSISVANASLPSAHAQTATSPSPADSVPATSTWLTYGADLQRSGVSGVRLAAPLNLVWRYSSDIAPKEFDTTPLVIGPQGQRRIYFAADRYLVCLDGQTGAQIWRSKALQRPVASPITLVSSDSGDMILAVTSSGQLNALRVNDGGLLWQIPPIAPVQNIAPTVIKTKKGDRIMIALATGRLIAYAFDGQLDTDWEVSLGSYSAAPTATPALALDGKYLYIPTQDQRLYVVNIPEARIEYPIALDIGSFMTPVVAGDHLIVVTGTTLLGLKLRTGQTKWRFSVKSSFGNPVAQVTANGTGKVFVGARNGKFYAVDADSGREIWETDLADSVTSVPVITDEMILVGTHSGLLFGLAPTDGKVLWRYRLNTQRKVERNDRDDNQLDQNNNDAAAPQGVESGFAGAFGGGGMMGNGGTVVLEKPTLLRTFGVASMPAVVNDAVYVLGDNAALYAFSTQPFDADPPQVINPQLSIPNSVGKPSLQRLDSEKPLLVPGRAPIQLVVELSDVGSGVDPASLRVSLNNQELPAAALGPLVDATGRLLITLVEAKDRKIASLQDGLFTVAIAARDYRGNQMDWTGNFLVDNTVPSPKAPVLAPVADDAKNDGAVF